MNYLISRHDTFCLNFFRSPDTLHSPPFLLPLPLLFPSGRTHGMCANNFASDANFLSCIKYHSTTADRPVSKLARGDQPSPLPKFPYIYNIPPIMA